MVCNGGAILILIGLLLGTGSGLSEAGCKVTRGEDVVFFPGLAAWNSAEKVWEAPIHGWVFEPETDSLKRAFLLGALRKSLGFTREEAQNAIFERRARPFLVDNKVRTLEVTLGGQTYGLKPSEPGGHVQEIVEVPNLPSDQWVPYQMSTCSNDSRVFSGTIRTTTGTGVIVISDIDDTIKVSEVRNRKKLLANTFLKEFEAVPGMAALYMRWSTQRPETVFYYLSASPWQLFTELSTFLKSSGFPDGLYSLKRFRWKDGNFFNLFQSPEAFKTPLISTLLARFPQKRFIFVGDSGEKDPEIYAHIARAHPAQIEHIYIRCVVPGEDARLAQAFAGVSKAQWTAFTDPKDIP